MYGVTILDLLVLFIGYPIALCVTALICRIFDDPNRW